MFCSKLLYIVLFVLTSFHSIKATEAKLGNEYKEMKNLVFAGGGVLGIAYIGALEVIQDQVLELKNIKSFAGTSVGSIVATLSALRYTPSEIKKIMIDLDFTEMLDQKITPVASDVFGNQAININGIFDLMWNQRGGFGLNSGNFLECWVEDLIFRKIGTRNATFADLEKADSEFAQLHILAANISGNTIGHFSFQETPDIVISKAIRASISIPMIFDVVKIDGEVFVDGGIYNNYPMDVFHDDAVFKHTLGLAFESHKFIKDFNLTEKNMAEEFGWEKYIVSLMSASFTVQHQEYIKNADFNRTIIIDDLGISPIDFSLNAEQKKQLFEEGYKAAIKYFEKADS